MCGPRLLALSDKALDGQNPHTEGAIVMPRMLADAKKALWLLDELPEDPKKPTASEINDGQNAACSVGKSGFNLGAGSPNTESDGALCDEGELQTPTSKTYEAAMNVFRFYDSETGQIDEEEDFLFQALKDFGSEVIVALRDGGKPYDEDAEDGDEVSIYVLTAGGMGRSTDTGGYQKREAHVTVTRAFEDVLVTDETP